MERKKYQTIRKNVEEIEKASEPSFVLTEGVILDRPRAVPQPIHPKEDVMVPEVVNRAESLRKELLRQRVYDITLKTYQARITLCRGGEMLTRVLWDATEGWTLEVNAPKLQARFQLLREALPPKLTSEIQLSKRGWSTARTFFADHVGGLILYLLGKPLSEVFPRTEEFVEEELE